MSILKLKPIWNLGNLPSIEESELKAGVHGNMDTIKMMRKIAREFSNHPKIRKLALNIIDTYQIPSHEHLREAWAIGDWVQKNVKYVKDIDDIETLHSPLMLIEQIEQMGYTRGDCDDMSLLIATLLLSIGIKPKFRTVRYRQSSGPYNHIYVTVYDNNYKQKKQRLVIDAIFKDQPIGFEVRHQSGKEHEV